MRTTPTPTLGLFVYGRRMVSVWVECGFGFGLSGRCPHVDLRVRFCPCSDACILSECHTDDNTGHDKAVHSLSFGQGGAIHARPHATTCARAHSRPHVRALTHLREVYLPWPFDLI